MDAFAEIRANGRPSGNFLVAARRLVAAVWEQAGLRLELLSFELAEERARFIGIVVACGAIVVGVAMTIAFVGVTLLIFAWDTPYRVWVAAAIAGGYAAVAVVGGLWLRHLLERASPLFRHSLAEWRRDVHGIRPDVETGP
jgi:uncharacterized membrane protein YqjE